MLPMAGPSPAPLPSLPLAKIRPSGLNTTEPTPSCPLKGRAGAVGWAGSATSHSRTAPSVVPAARVWPSGLNATELTKAPLDSVLEYRVPVRKLSTWFDRVLASARALGAHQGEVPMTIAGGTASLRNLRRDSPSAPSGAPGL